MRLLDWGGHGRATVAATPLVKALQLQLLTKPERCAIMDGVVGSEGLTVGLSAFHERFLKRF